MFLILKYILSFQRILLHNVFLFFFTVAGVRKVGVECLPILHHNAVLYIFWWLWIIGQMLRPVILSCGKRVLLKPVLLGVGSVAVSLTTHSLV